MRNICSDFLEKQRKVGFFHLYGFEENFQDVYKKLIVNGEYLFSKANKKKCAQVSLKELKLKFDVITENVRDIHLKHRNSLIQVASQTNGLEMPRYTRTRYNKLSE